MSCEHVNKHAVKMPSDLIVILLSNVEANIVVPNDNVFVVNGTDLHDTIRHILNFAPKECIKAVFIYPNFAYYHVFSEMVFALQAFGFDNIRAVGQAFRDSLLLVNSKFSIKNGEYICLYMPNDAQDGHGVVYKKTTNGFENTRLQVESLSQAFFCESTKYVIVRCNTFLTPDAQAAVDKSNKKIYISPSNVRELFLGFNWTEFVKTPKLYLEDQPTQLHFRYGNMLHHLDVDYNEIPFTKTFELDIEDATDLTLSVSYENNGFHDVKTIAFCGTKRRNVKTTVSMPITLLPDFSAVVLTEKNPIGYYVLSVDWDYDTKLFSGTVITKDNVDNVISECEDVTDVFKTLSKTQSSTKLRGVIVNYWNTDDFPVDIHRKLIKAMPSPTTKLIVGQIHAYFAIHLQSSCVQAADSEKVALTDWSDPVAYQTFYKFTKYDKKFNYDEELFGDPDSTFEHVVIIVDISPTSEQRHKANTLYPDQNVYFSSRSNLSSANVTKYAWEYFSGKNYDGYLVPCFTECYIWLRNDFVSNFLPPYFCSCKGFTITRMIDARGPSAPDGMLAYFATHNHGYIKYVGFARPLLYIRADMNDCQLTILKTHIGSDLTPTATMTSITSFLDALPAPYVVTTENNFPDASAVFFINTYVFGTPFRFWVRSLYNNKMMDSGVMLFDVVITFLKSFAPFVKTKQIFLFAADYMTMPQRLKYVEILQQLKTSVLLLQSSQFFALRLYQENVRLDIGKSIIFDFDFTSMLLTKHENGFKCNGYLRNNLAEKLSVDEKYDIVPTSLMSDTTTQFLYKYEAQIQLETYHKFVQCLNDGTNFHGFLIDTFDDIFYEAEFDDKIIPIHRGRENLPFEVTTTLDIGKTSSVKVYAIVYCDKYLVKHFTMKTKKHRKVTLTMKQLNLCEITASLIILEDTKLNDEHLYATTDNHSNKLQETIKVNSESKHPCLPSEATQSVENLACSSASPQLLEITFTFTNNNRIIVNAGPDYTGKPELTAYFRMVSSKFGPVVTIGEKAKAAYKAHPKTVIYDIPGLLAADSDPSNENLTWSFETSRTTDGTLLIHLGDGAFTTPVPLFGVVVQSVFLYVKKHVTETVETIKIGLPRGAVISEVNLKLVSDKIGINLQMT